MVESRVKGGIQVHRTVLYIATSLDGCVAGDDDDLSWLTRFNDVDYDFAAFFAGIGAIIQGRRTYEIERANGWSYPRPVPTFVLSHEPPASPPAHADIVFTGDDLATVLARAQQRTDQQIWIEGGAALAQQFLDRGLVDTIVLSLAPVILGRGIPLFANLSRQMALTLTDLRRFDRGLVQLVYTANADAP